MSSLQIGNFEFVGQLPRLCISVGPRTLWAPEAPDNPSDQTRGIPSLVTNPAVFITDWKEALACASITVWTQAGQSQKASQSLAAIRTRSTAASYEVNKGRPHDQDRKAEDLVVLVAVFQP
jgi:hypothetical protein